MPGNYRYEEERNRGHRGGRRGGYDDRMRDEEEFDLQDRDRGGAEYGREDEGRHGSSGSWNRGSERDYGRSLGGRGSGEGFEDEGRFRGSYGSMGRDENRFGDYGREQRGQQWSGRGSYQGGQGGGLYGGTQGDQYGQYGQSGQYGRSQGQSGQSQYGQGSRYDQGTSYGQRGYGQGGGFSGVGGGSQADGWTSEPEEMRWGRQQGLYGSSEYGGYISSQRSQSDYQSHVGKGPKNWQRSDERIKEEVNEALARHPEIDASDLEVRVDKGEVTLTGTVTDRKAKRLAEDVAERVFGAKEVQNQIRVQSSGTGQGFGDREVTRTLDREGRSTTESQESQSRKPGTTSSGSSATR